MSTRDQQADPGERDLVLLDPGRDPEMETARREQPTGASGILALITAVIVALAVAYGWRRRGLPRAARLALVVAGLLAGLVVVEGVLQATASSWRLHVKVRDGCYHDNPRGYFDRSTFYGDAGISAWCTDRLSDTWAACDAPSAETGGARVRIMAIGDSFTDGVGVFARDAWPAALERELGAGTAVVNCGRAASATGHVAKRLLSHEARHDPDIVVYAFVLNDVAPPADAAVTPGVDIGFQLTSRELYARHLEAVPLLGALAPHLAVARFIGERLATRSIASRTLEMYRATYADPERPELVEALDMTATMHELASDRGARFLVALWPLLESLDDYPLEAAHAVIVDGLTSRGVPVVDLLPTFRGSDEAALWAHPTDHHPNEIAHLRAAEVIAETLRQLGWVASAAAP